MNIFNQTRNLLKQLQSKASSVNPVGTAVKNFNPGLAMGINKFSNIKSPVTGQTIGQVTKQQLNNPNSYLPYSFSRGIGIGGKQMPKPLANVARPLGQTLSGFVDMSTFGLAPQPKAPITNRTERAANIAGMGLGFVNPMGMMGVLGKTGTMGAGVTSKLLPKMTPKLLAKIAPAVGYEAAQTATLLGGKKAMGQEFDPKMDLLFGLGLHGAFSGVGRVMAGQAASNFKPQYIRNLKYRKIDDLISHEGAPDRVRVEFYKNKIRKGEFVAPIYTIKEGTKHGIEDGKHRFQAYKELGYKFVPTITDRAQAERLTKQMEEADFNIPKMGIVGKAKGAEAGINPSKMRAEYPDSANNPLYQEMRKAQETLMAKIEPLRNKYKTDAEIPAPLRKQLNTLKADWQAKAKTWEDVYVNKPSVTNAGLYDAKLYHGGSPIDKVNLKKSNRDGTFYMTDNPTYAKSYGGSKSVVTEMQLDPKANLADMRKPSGDLISQIENTIKNKESKNVPYGDKNFSFYPYSTKDVIQGLKDGKAHFAELPQVKQVLRELGYDGQITSEVPHAKNIGVWNENIVKPRVAQPTISDAKKLIGETSALPKKLDQTLQQQMPRIPLGNQPAIKGLLGTQATGLSMSPTKSSSYNTSDYIKELTKKQKMAANEGNISGIKQKGKSALAKLKSEWVDETSPIMDPLTSAEKAFKFKVLPTKDIRLQIDRVLKQRTLASQFAEDNGLIDVVKKVPDIDALDQYLIAKQAARVSQRGIVTGRDLARDRQLIKDLAPAYEEYAQQVNQYSRKLLDYSVNTGLIDKKLANQLVNTYPDYVPLNRVFSELEKTSGIGRNKAVASIGKQSIVQRLKGSEREITSPTESLLLKTQDAFSQGERNVAAKQLAGYRNLPGFEGLIKELPEGQRAAHTFSYLDNGVKKTFETTREMEAAAKALTVEQMGILAKIISTPTRILQLGATGLNIPFVVTNIVKDDITAFINSNRAASISILNPRNYVKSMFGAVKHDDFYKEMVRNAGGGTSFDIAREAPSLSIQKLRHPNYYTARHPLALLRAVENTIGRSEEFGRLKNYGGTYEALIKEGRTPADAKILAGQASRENTANFARRGSFGRVLNWMVPFFNAGIQGSRQLVRSFENRPKATAAKVGTVIFTPIAVSVAWNLSDPERKKIYSDIPEYDKENNIIIIPPNATQDAKGRWNVIKIPLPPGLSNLGTIVRRSLETAEGLDPIRFGEIATNLITAGSSVDVTSKNKLASTFTPQLAKPLVEMTTNTNLYTGQKIVPEYLKNKPAELQTRPSVTPIATGIGRLLNTSPLMVENLAQTTMGGLGSQLIGKESPIGNIQRRFSKAGGGNLLEKVYDDSTKLQSVESQAKDLVEQGETDRAVKLVKDNKELFIQAQKIKAYRKEVNQLQEFKNKVRKDNRLTKEQKDKVMSVLNQKLYAISVSYTQTN